MKKFLIKRIVKMEVELLINQPSPGITYDIDKLKTVMSKDLENWTNKDLWNAYRCDVLRKRLNKYIVKSNKYLERIDIDKRLRAYEKLQTAMEVTE